MGPGVVQITTTIGASTSSDGQFQQSSQALGSGFVLDKEGHIATNFHVIDGATSIEVRFSNDDTLKATLVGSDPSTDVALLKVDASPDALTPLSLADSTQVEVGDPVVAIGNPFGLERTVTTGIVSALQRAVKAPNGYSIDHVIQTDAAINHGNSGGPLLNTRGAVIGINSQIETGGIGRRQRRHRLRRPVEHRQVRDRPAARLGQGRPRPPRRLGDRDHPRHREVVQAACQQGSRDPDGERRARVPRAPASRPAPSRP